MKKIFVAALAAVAVATPAMAFDVTWKGDFNNRFSYSTQADLSSTKSSDAATYVNVTAPPAMDTKKNSKDADFFGEVKYRLWVEAQDDEKKVKGVVGLEWGGLTYGRTKDAGGGGATELPFGGDQTTVTELMHAYVDFEVPFDTASRVTLGLQPVGYNAWLWSDNAAGVKYKSKRDKLSYSLGWFRDDQTSDGKGTSARNTNDDVYALDVNYKIDDASSVGAFWLYRESGAETIAGVANSMDQEHWFGLEGKTQIANVFLGGTFIYETGEIKGGSAFPNGKSTLDREGFLGNIEATAKIDKARVKVGYLYASGDDDPTDKDVENFNVIDMYTGGLGSVVIFDSFADDNTMVTSPYFLDKGISLAYLHGDFDLNDKASVGLGYLWHNTAEDVGKNDDLGHEFVARGSYKLTKNLTAAIAAGYFIGGDLWDDLASDGNGDDVIRSDASIRLKF